MPHIANTPESLLPRSDSLNPAVTCRGITTSGRPCRRALASSTSSSPASSPAKGARSPQVTDLSTLYCWQHKDQASTYAVEPNGKTDSLRLNQRSSMDTLMDRLGILDVNDQETTKPKKPKKGAHSRRKPQSTFCCFVLPEEEEDTRPPRPARPSTNRPHQQAGKRAGSARPPATHRKPAPPNPGNTHHQPKRHPTRPGPPSNRASSQTQALLAWIPPTLSPETTSHLLTELAKPISDADDAGYIYMFWVTPSAPSPPPRDIASSLFPPPAHRPSHGRSVSEAIRAADDLNVLASKPSTRNPGSIRLKIGRTSNVQRRLNEWTRQCSHNLTLIRYYPYTRSSPSPSPSASPGRGGGGALDAGRKVPHVHRVERLIHIELRDIRVSDLGRCDECNREHREWFEIAAEKNELRRVEECIRRWVQWGERQGSRT